MRTANPALSSDTFDRFDVYEPTQAMTLQGTVNKTGLLLIVLVAAASITWRQFNAAGPAVMPWVIGGAVVGLIFALITSFKPTWSPVTAPLYAGAEGLFLGGLSAMIEARYPNIAFQAVCLTFGTLFSLLVAYRSGLIRATENFKLGVMAATGGIFVVYMVGWIMSFFGSGIPFIHEGGIIGICFSLFVVVIASLNLVLDFDFIETGVERGAPRYMEWYAAFGLLVTLVWLYVEILRLLSKLRGRD